MADPPLLLPTLVRSGSDTATLPRRKQNLFIRLLNNRSAGERDCTNMLCSVMLASPGLREDIITWLASQSCRHLHIPPDLEALEIDTEQPVEGKRDDLRLTLRDPTTREPTWLCTIEVKTGAGFHESSPILGAELDAELSPVHQLLNYDKWLTRLPLSDERKAGFVLSRDPNVQLPAGLACNWTPVTWAALGRELDRLLTKRDLPADERLLASHLGGFISDNLSTSFDVTDPNPIRFDDLALLRAHANFGKETEARIDALVARLVPIVKSSGLAHGRNLHERQLFDTRQRSIVYQWVPAAGDGLYLGAGVLANRAPRLAVWFETPPKHKFKPKLRAAVEPMMDALRAKNPAWMMIPDHRGWFDLWLEKPLEPIFAADDQAATFEKFFTDAFEDLRSVNMAEALAGVVQA